MIKNLYQQSGLLQYPMVLKRKSSCRFINFLILYLFTCSFSLFINHSYAQNTGVSVNTTGASANPKALLDIDATGMNPKEGLLLPRMTTADRNNITPPIPESLLIYNTDTHCFEAYYNGGWVAFGCLASACQVPTQPIPP